MSLRKLILQKRERAIKVNIYFKTADVVPFFHYRDLTRPSWQRKVVRGIEKHRISVTNDEALNVEVYVTNEFRNQARHFYPPTHYTNPALRACSNDIGIAWERQCLNVNSFVS